MIAPLSFDAYEPDGSPRVTAGWFRRAWPEVVAERDYIPTYEYASMRERWMHGEYDKPLYEVRQAVAA